MKKRKLKGFVLPTLYLLITITLCTGIVLFASDYSVLESDYDYGVNILKENTKTVLIEDEIATSTISSPVDENIEISVHFYNMEDDEERQQSSLIYYENTYMPNTGVLYTVSDAFEVKAIFSGTITEIEDDEFFGKYVVVEHTKALKSYYYGITDIEVSEGDEITSGTVLGMSQNNAINNDVKSFLLEIYYNNELINPEEVIGTKVTDYE